MFKSIIGDKSGAKHVKLLFNAVRKKSSLESIAFRSHTQRFSSLNLGSLNTNFEDGSGIAQVSLNRPKKGNAINLEMWDSYKTAFETISRDDSVRAVIVTGEGNHLTTGMDLSVFQEMDNLKKVEPCPGRQREGLKNVIQYFQDCISAAEKCPVPVIACITGYCIGGGVDLITACDLRYCTTDASFCIKETELAIVADVGTLARLPKTINEQVCRELAYTGRTIDGREAERIGLVAKCFETRADMDAYVRDCVVGPIVGMSPLTIRGVKQNILYSRDNTVEESLGFVKQWNASHIWSEDLERAFTAAMSKSKEGPIYRD